MTRFALHKPQIEDHGLFAHHDQACAVCRLNYAVLDMQSGNFEPCWECQLDGWKLGQRSWLWKLAKKARRS